MAYDEAPLTPVQERTQTPDLTAASGQPGGGGSTRGLMELLQGLGGGAAAGGIPQEALLGLMQGPSFGQRMGAAAAGGVAFMRGQPNPAIAMLEEQRRQQQGAAELIQKQMDQQRLATQWGITNQRLEKEAARHERNDLFHQKDVLEQRATAANKIQLAFYDSALATATDPEAKQVLATKKAGLMEKQMGIPMPQNVIDNWTAPSPVDTEREKQIARAFNTARERNDPTLSQIAARQFNLDPSQVAFYTKAVSSDSYLADLGLSSQAKLTDLQNQYELRKQQVIEGALPLEQRKDPKWFAALEAQASKAYPTTDFLDLTREQRTRVYEMARLQDQAQKLQEKEQAAQIDLSKGLQLFRAKQGFLQAQKEGLTVGDSAKVMTNLKGEQPDPSLTVPEARRQGFFQVQPKELLETGQQAMALKQLEVFKDSIAQLEKAHLTAESKGLFGYANDQRRIMTARYTDPASRALLVNIEAMKGELVNILRKTGDNARAAQLLAPTIQSISPAAGAQAMRQVLGNLEAALRAAGAHSRTPELFTDIPTIFPRPSDIPGQATDPDGWTEGRKVR